ncbi:FAD-dependent urate hydroxylase [Talaromyces pinophilus]|nr:FAD-dependent urate hydroxylase [Talaromyces pinophilus]
MSEINKVLIIGGGPTGIVAAILLKQRNRITPVVYEAQPEPTTIGGAIGIPSNGLRLFKLLGVYEELISRGSSQPDVTLHSVQGSVMGQMDLISWSENKTGFGMLKIKRADLMDVLYGAARKADIEVNFNKSLVGIEEGDQQVTANFHDGTSGTADLLLGCDGVSSAVRKLYVDPDIQPEYTGVTDIFSLIPTSDRPTPVGSLHGLHVTFTSEGMFAITSATSSSDEYYWFFSSTCPNPLWIDNLDGRGKHEPRNVDDAQSMLRDALKDVRGEWGDLLRDFVRKSKSVKFHPIFTLPLGGIWHRGRCLILGDAAHAMSPHASQGVSMALEDVFFLSRLLSRSSLPLEDVFRIYDNKRRPRTDEIYKTAKKNGQMRKKALPWRLWLNELILTAFLYCYNAFRLHKLGFGQSAMVYDIEKEDI